MSRYDGRENNQLRPIRITKNFTKYAEGSVLIEFGDTKVICNATVEENVPPFLRESGSGWVTAEYAMLPRATASRNKRDINKLKLNPRATEIQRLIGRALRAAVDLEALGERSITVDCDVIQADGGTRTASITGGFVALAMACQRLVEEGVLEKTPLRHYISAISVGIVDGEPMLDLCYEEDSSAQVDLNCVMNDDGQLIELQGTGEGRAFTVDEQRRLVDLCQKGIRELMAKQRAVLEGQK